MLLVQLTAHHLCSVLRSAGKHTDLRLWPLDSIAYSNQTARLDKACAVRNSLLCSAMFHWLRTCSSVKVCDYVFP